MFAPPSLVTHRSSSSTWTVGLSQRSFRLATLFLNNTLPMFADAFSSHSMPFIPRIAFIEVWEEAHSET